ncbi:ADP-ribosylation factor-related protein 1 [Porphyridium purpureum]|uniref:ADP-ribosylation factor-related protein 1 n=1 Tax=Porphyridium purpureum TaxID=35688 RepID=A0A5J4YL67_PORPP|nr:ADP-ribosylation factor-related protein 1 [Porphyridium purpureum]|eukprot:POR7616..scf249_10
MFGLAYGVFKQMTERPLRKVIVLGEEGCGKTTYLDACKHVFAGCERTEPDKIQPTVGLNVAKLALCGASVLLWDLGGRPALRAIWERYLDQADGVVFLIDATDLARFAQSKQTLKAVLARPALENRPLLVYVNKQDVQAAQIDAGGSDAAEHISLLQVSSVVRSVLGMHDDRPLLVLPCIATEELGVREGLEWIVSRIGMQIENGEVAPRDGHTGLEAADASNASPTNSGPTKRRTLPPSSTELTQASSGVQKQQANDAQPDGELSNTSMNQNTSTSRVLS